MNKHRLEEISSLVDDRQNDSDIINALSNDENLRRTWAHYHLISNCLKRYVPERIDCSLADRIKASLADEPAILIPLSKRTTLIQKTIKPVTNFAIAASIVAMAIFVWQQERDTVVVEPGIASVSNSVDGTNKQITSATGEVERKPRNFQYEDEAQLRLDRYLVNYNEYRADSGMGGILPYVRIVAYEAKK